MRRRALAFLGALCLLLTGCNQWMSDSYSSVKPHIEGFQQAESVDTEVASDYQGLMDALCRLVRGHVTQASVDVSQYPDTLEQELNRAIVQVKREDPLVAYAVDSIQVEMAEVGVRRMVSVTITYRRSQEQVDQIQTTWGASGVESKVAEALNQAESSLTLRVTGYQPMDLGGYVRDYYKNHRDTIMECPIITTSVYPSQGSVRILEIAFGYDTNQETLLGMRREVQVMLSSAAGYVRGQSDQTVQAERLYSFLRPLYCEAGTSETPVYSLLCLGVGDSQSVATVFDLLCSQVGLECQVISGSRAGETWYWNLLSLDGVWCHVDLLGDWDEGTLVCRYDPEMWEYSWDTEAYPACPLPKPPETTEPQEPTETGNTEETEETVAETAATESNSP